MPLLSLLSFLFTFALSDRVLALPLLKQPPSSVQEWLSRAPEQGLPAFLQWAPLTSYPQPKTDPFQLARAPLRCDSQELYPASPYQESKQYEVAYFGRFNHRLLDGFHHLCLVQSHWRKNECLAPDSLYVILISDLYFDRCGNLYRGYWTVSFPKSFESMGTLVSKGRTVYPKPGSSDFLLDLEEGQTYPVEMRELEFITPPTEDERSAAQKQRARALEFGFALDEQGLLFYRPARN